MKSDDETRVLLEDTLWIAGSSCAGKSTISRLLATKHKLPLLAIDYLVDHVFPNMITEKDYPNLSVLKLNGVPWLFGLEVDTFSEFQVASQREYLDLLVVHLEKERGAKRTLLVDAGEIYEPNMLSRYLQQEQVAFLSLPEEMALLIWKSRAWATEMLRKYDNPDKLFRRWMEFDKIITERILRQCRELNLPVFLRDQDTPAQILLERVETIFCNRLK